MMLTHTTAAARRFNPVAGEPQARETVVLIVTADANLRAAAARIVTREGYRAVTASHAGHAVLACLRERIDVVVSELSMEEMSGPSLAARLRRLQPTLGTIYFANPGTTECAGVLVRPFTSVDLVRALVNARAAAASASTSGEA
jgi:PleD family two-component response regulator